MRYEKFTNGFVWLSILVGAISSVKALNAFLDFGFEGVWADILSYYSEITEPLRLLVSKIPLFVDAPAWLTDFLLLYLVLVMTGVRSTVLPYRFDDYYRMHNTRRTYKVEFSRHGDETLDEFLDHQDKFDLEHLQSAMHKDDKFVVTLRQIIPRWELVTRQFLKCFTLLPVITLEPLRSMDKPARFVRQMLKNASPDSTVIPYKDDGGEGFYARWALEVDKIRLDGVIQIISLPILVALFLIGATYIN